MIEMCALDRNAFVIPGDELAYPIDLRLKVCLFVCFSESFIAFLLLPFPIS